MSSEFAGKRGLNEYSGASLSAGLAIPPEEMLFVHLKNGSSRDLRVDGSSTPVDFTYVVPTGKEAIIARCILKMQDVSIKLHEFLGTGASLTNGILVTAHDSDDSTLVDFLDGDPIKNTIDFANLAAVDLPLVTASGQDPDSVPVRWSLFKTGYYLKLTAGQYLRVRIQDNLSSGIGLFEWHVQGRIITL